MDSLSGLRHISLWEALISTHFLPTAVAAAAAPVVYVFGNSKAAAVTMVVGLSMSALLTRRLPIITLEPVAGTHHVGIRELLCTKGSAPDGYPPLTVFYPTAEKPRSVCRWLPFMDQSYLWGTAAAIGASRFLLRDRGLTTVRLSEDAKPLSLFREDGTVRPIFIFSHGLIGFAKMYSVFSASIAAQGGIVISVNHGDRSAAYYRDQRGDVCLTYNTALARTHTDRFPQLEIRSEEMQNTIAHVVNGDILRLCGFAGEEVDSYVAGHAQVILAGHSFGASTALAAAHEEEKRMRAGDHENFYENIAGVIAQDPWLVPLWGRFTVPEPREGEEELRPELMKIPPGDRTYTVPSVLYHSQERILDKPSWAFFTAVCEAVRSQVDTPGLLLPQQLARIKDATARLRAANVSDTAKGPFDVEGFLADGWFATQQVLRTGHLSLPDLAFIDPILSAKPYQTRDPKEPVRVWAEQAMQFAEVYLN